MQGCSFPCRTQWDQRSRDFDESCILGGTDVEAPSGKKQTKKTPSENSNLLLAFLMLLIANISILPAMKIITQKYEDLFPRYWAESFMWMTLI